MEHDCELSKDNLKFFDNGFTFQGHCSQTRLGFDAFRDEKKKVVVMVVRTRTGNGEPCAIGIELDDAAFIRLFIKLLGG